ncbi:MAG: DUF3416 domain-containing protein [Myxococcales bacterium]|nr:DUF3416 domain-containing protein [Myxococcales bacterium]
MPRPEGRRRVALEDLSPIVDAGRFAAKAIVREPVRVFVKAFADGHDQVAADLVVRDPDGGVERTRMAPLGQDRFEAHFVPETVGKYHYWVEAFIDRFGTWSRDTKKKADAGVDVQVERMEGARLLEATIARAPREEASQMEPMVARLRQGPGLDGLHSGLIEWVRVHEEPRFVTRWPIEVPIVVDRELARFSAWYELFPRSASPVESRLGTLRDVEARLEDLEDMGFDILYLPPIHPIGTQHRKGRNNARTAQEGDLGSPWAIGSVEGGHEAVHPELGTIEDVASLVEKARTRRIEIALDIAFQCAPDHPWVKEHPSWFRRRGDGSIQYAENPPKKYEDIYPLDFESDDWEGLWTALRDVFLHWCERGVRVFRVDNPHTKPFEFWEWVIAEVKSRHPETIFLSEAFTRPNVAYRLGQARIHPVV